MFGQTTNETYFNTSFDYTVMFFGLWEEAGEPREPQQTQGEHPWPGIEPETFSICSNRTEELSFSQTNLSDCMVGQTDAILPQSKHF